MTGNELVRGALRLIGIVAAGETVSAEDYADGIEVANLLLDSLATERLAIMQTTEVQATVTGAANYAVSTGGAFNTPQPPRLAWLYWRDGTTDYTDTREISGPEYGAITDKLLPGTPEVWWYQNGVVTVYPVPTTGVLRAGVLAPLTQIASGAVEMSLAPGYAEMLRFNLAVRLAPEYEREASATVVRQAAVLKSNVKNMNTRPVRAALDLCPVGGANIISG